MASVAASARRVLAARKRSLPLPSTSGWQAHVALTPRRSPLTDGRTNRARMVLLTALKDAPQIVEQLGLIPLALELQRLPPGRRGVEPAGVSLQPLQGRDQRIDRLLLEPLAGGATLP